ncbi:MAG: protein kinase [Gemmatales bacterium]
MPVATSNQFLETLRRSGLIEESVLDEALSSYTGTTEEPARIAEYLIQRKLITSFQAKSLIAGRTKGLIIGAYRILDKIGSGGMGVVYLAEHDKLMRRVAIKILPEDKTRDKLALERFYREARAAAALDHPNIVKAYDVSDFQGLHYLVMEYIDGANLQKYLDTKGPLPWKTAVNIVLQCCKGLQHAHERNMVHRDIKPANILVDKAGQVKILDLGLARSFQMNQDNLTQELSDGKDVMGSIDYIAPEQAIANNAVDIRADIYSLGATVYCLITGKPPVEGTTAQKLLQHQMQMPPMIHTIRPEVPEAISHVVAKMLAKRPEHRYQTPLELANSLSAIASINSQQLPSFSGPTSGGPISGGPISGPIAHPSTGNLYRQTASFDPTAPILGNSQSLASASTKIEAKNSSTTRLKKKTERITLKSKLSRKTVLALCAALAVLIPAITFIFIYLSDDRKAAADTKPMMTWLTGTKYKLNFRSRFPDLVLKDIEDKEVKITDMRGKVILVQFWGYWCAPCLKMLPKQRELYEKYKNRPFALLGVNTDRPDELADMIVKTPVPWRNVRNVQPGGKLTTEMGVKVSPTLVLIDNQQNIFRIWEGTPPPGELEEVIESLVKRTEEPPPTDVLKK